MWNIFEQLINNQNIQMLSMVEIFKGIFNGGNIQRSTDKRNMCEQKKNIHRMRRQLLNLLALA